MAIAEPVVWRWTVDEYHQAADAGLFGPEDRLELLDGTIFRMSPQRSEHATSCELVEDVLARIFASGYVVRGQKPLTLGPAAEPEPDVAVVSGSIRDYARRHPSTAVLIVEVSDTTVRFDLGRKARTYARAAIPEYWALVLPRRVLVVHREPDTVTGRYRSITEYGATDTASPLAAPDAGILVADLLP
jgi:Uma2 family endonuclease